jgi:tRNA U34 5-methylaminomethyl-2-thiouridine-forming methyltransferase MnmC
MGRHYHVKLPLLPYLCRMPVELYQTKDLSHTLYNPELDETYHSRNGAVEEAMYVYIGRGLMDKVIETTLCTEVSILEVGFGTGLNAWLTAIECDRQGIKGTYHSLETFPLPAELISQLNYAEQTTVPYKQLYRLLHEAGWNEPSEVTGFFELTKFEQSLQHFVAPRLYDIIYFDAFAPDKQPELWTQDLFQKLYDCLNPNGVIVTYSSKGNIKRMWKTIGFEVERLPGPPFKRHMLRGTKKIAI